MTCFIAKWIAEIQKNASNPVSPADISNLAYLEYDFQLDLFFIALVTDSLLAMKWSSFPSKAFAATSDRLSFDDWW